MPSAQPLGSAAEAEVPGALLKEALAQRVRALEGMPRQEREDAEAASTALRKERNVAEEAVAERSRVAQEEQDRFRALLAGAKQGAQQPGARDYATVSQLRRVEQRTNLTDGEDDSSVVSSRLGRTIHGMDG